MSKIFLNKYTTTCNYFCTTLLTAKRLYLLADVSCKNAFKYWGNAKGLAVVFYLLTICAFLAKAL